MRRLISGLIAMILILCSTALAQTSPGFSDFNVVSTIYEPYPAEPGKYIDLYIKAENRGTKSATDTAFELLPKYPFTIESAGDALKNYGTLDPFQPVLLKYRVRVDKDAVSGNNKIDLRYRTGSSGTWYSVSFDIFVKPKDTVLSIEKVESIPSEIPAGGKAIVRFTLKNLAKTRIKDISLKLDMSGTTLPFAPTDSTTEKRIELLDPEEEKSILFNIISDASGEPKIYKIPITLSYSDEAGTSYTKQDIIGLAISSEPQLAVYMETSDSFTAGTTGSVVFSVSNTGPTQAKFVTIVLLPSEDYEIIGSDRSYIGNLDSDDFDTAEFKISTDKSLNSTKIPVTASVSYKDAYNNVLSKEYQQHLTIYSTEDLIRLGKIKKEGGPEGIIIAVVVVVILFLAYKRFTRRKSN